MWHLVITSAWFLIPAVKGFKKGKRTLPLINTVTSLASMNYWRDPKPGWRRTVDYTLAKTNFAVHHLYMKPGDVPVDLSVGLFWWLSNRGGPRWPLWHTLFHAMVTAGMLQVTS